MSEKSRIIIGISLIAAAVAIPLTALFPIHHLNHYTYSVNDYPPVYFSEIPYLSSQDSLNTDSAEALTKLPGVGVSISSLIVEERETHGRFWYPEDLTAVRGIGVKKLEQIRPLLSMETDESEE